MTKKKSLILLFCAVLILVVIVASILWFGSSREEEKVSIGVILPGSSLEMGWNGVHYQGIKEACDDFDVNLVLYENVPEYSGKCEKVVREMADQGIGAIFLESYNYSEEIADTILELKDINFFCCSSNDITSKKYTTYFARVYQARYLSGIVAGMKTKTNHIGYVAAMNNDEVNRGINAFSLGVRSVNPKAEIDVIYTDSWDDEKKERQEVNFLVNQCQADVLSYHQNQPFVVEEAEKLGVYVIGYNIEKGDFSPCLLTSVVSNWKMVYREMVKDYIQGEKNVKENYWIGIEKEAVELNFFSDEVSQETKDAVSLAKERMMNNIDVFSGLIKDNTGKVRCQKEETIRDAVLQDQMDWLVEGVVVYEEIQK